MDVSKTDVFYKIVYGLAPKYLINYLNTNDNLVYKTRTSQHNNINRFERITGNFRESFFFSMSMNAKNWLFPSEKPKILNVSRAKP